MTVYKHRNSQPFRWVFALIIFILAMTITFDGVDGVNLPKSNNGSGNGQAAPPAKQDTSTVTVYTEAGSVRELPEDRSAPITAVPEPATILLIGGGLSLMYALRKRTA